jgi:diguanylate cyclase (GGDEF)-like protein/PAS domain S-box-containing protein
VKILIADDEIFSRNVLKKALANWGHEVIEASDGAEAWDRLQSDGELQLALLDWIMPGMEGIEVIHRVRDSRSADEHYVYIILLTQKAAPEEIVAGLDAGADDYMVKPFDPNELRVRIRCGQRIIELQSKLIEAKARQESINSALQREILERKQAQSDIVRAKQEWEQTFDAVPDLISIVDSDHRILRINNTTSDRLGISFEDAIGRKCYEIHHGVTERPETCPVATAKLKATEIAPREIVMEPLDRVFLVSVSPLRDETGRASRFVHVARDITEQKRLEERLRELATSDSLTGLANRRHFLELARQELIRAERYRRDVSLLVMDIDHFKRVNDTFGHEMGDRVLKAVADVSRESLRNIDILARIGGEEFAGLLPHTGLEQAASVAERVRLAVANNAVLTGRGTVHVTISIGVSEAAGSSLDLDSFLRCADEALYAAKRAGRNRVEIYSP